MSAGRIILFIVIAAALIGAGIWYDAKINEQAQNTAREEQQSAAQAQASIASQLKIEDIKVGTGATAQNGDSVTVNYVGKLTDGTVFDSSLKRNQPLTFVLGQGQVIKGWDLGVLGMKIGGERRLTIPPELGYGASGYGPIPPNATLIFTIDLLSVSNLTSP